MRVVGLDHINVPTPDFHAAMEILRDALGMYAAAVPGHGWFEQAAWLHDASGTVVLHLASADQRHSGYKTAFKRAASRKRSDPSPRADLPGLQCDARTVRSAARTVSKERV